VSTTKQTSADTRLISDADIAREFASLGDDRQPLSTLPNREGFKFRGIRKDGGRYMNCRLKSLPGCGMYIVDQGGYVYDDAAPVLAGWMPHPCGASASASSESSNDGSK
jgi:hypothetical protein